MPLHPRSGVELPRRSFFAVFAFVSFVLLVTIGLATLGAHPGPTLRFERSDDGQWRAKAETRAAPAGDKYLIGVGKADITGPVVEIGFAGYADLAQVGTGLRQRIYSRAFVVGDVSKPSDRFVYLVLDTQSGDTAIRRGIIEGVQALGSAYSVYNRNNIAVTGTHSHAGPGAWFNYLLPQVTSLGFDRQSYQAIVDGAVLSIKRAHESLTEGYLDVGTTEVTDGAINRSLWAYLANPESERSRYSSSTDTTLTLLRFQRASDGKNIGVLTWYPTHGTSILQNSTHVAGDNKGVAALLLEKDLAGDASAASGFVAGFSQANVGDTTPNVLGAWCDDGSGQQCSLENSTCADGKSQSCHGRGPAFRALDLGISSCYEIGRRQFAGAKSVYNSLASSSSTPITGTSVKSFHFFHDMSFFKFTLPDGTTGQTCPAALGYSFAAGTSDGPGAFDFTQADSGDPDANPLWAVVSGLLRTPTAEQVACQRPKPVLLDVGEMSTPYAWSPNIVDVQMLRVGQLVVIVAPGEATTMGGRRWKEAVKEAARTIIDGEPVVVLGGPANTYAVSLPSLYLDGEGRLANARSALHRHARGIRCPAVRGRVDALRAQHAPRVHQPHRLQHRPPRARLDVDPARGPRAPGQPRELPLLHHGRRPGRHADRALLRAGPGAAGGVVRARRRRQRDVPGGQPAQQPAARGDLRGGRAAAAGRDVVGEGPRRRRLVPRVHVAEDGLAAGPQRGRPLLGDGRGRRRARDVPVQVLRGREAADRERKGV